VTEHYELCVVGGGSGGFAAAWAGARLGLRTLLVEKAETLGGNAVRCGVNCWEMGAGGTGIPFDLYRRLKQQPRAVGIYSYGRHGSHQQPDEPYRFPGGELLIDPERRYLDTLQRHGLPTSADTKGKRDWMREHWHGVPFEPMAMARMQEKVLEETGCCDVRMFTAFDDIEVADGCVRSVTLNDGATVTADVFVDGTADGLLCLAAGAEVMAGQESRAAFNEPGAPETASNKINGVTLVFRISPTTRPAVQTPPRGTPREPGWRSKAEMDFTLFPWCSIVQYPNGDRCVNMLPTMEGHEFVDRGYIDAYEECRRRVYAQWWWMQREFEEFQSYRLAWIAPGLGVRESRRIRGEKVLTQNDILAGLSGQTDPDIVCIADHAMDTHGAATGRAGCGELDEPYGVPLRCLIPKGFRNLMIACRGASFSSIAASSCRLSRTMMQLGQAAGTAAAVAKQHRTSIPDVPAEALRASLREQHVQLEWPMPAALREHLSRE